MNEKPSTGKEPIYVGLIALFLFINLLCYANHMPLFHEEPRRAMVAQEMLLTGDYVVPRLFQVPYHKKPPMQNWLVALASQPAGTVTGFSARLVSVLALLATCFGVYAFMRRRTPERALLAFLVCSTNFLMMCEYGNKVEPDIVLTAFTLLAYVVYMSGPTRFLPVLVSALLGGGAVLTKGLFHLYFYPGLLLFLLTEPRPRARKLTFLGLHFLLSLVLPALWLGFYHRHGNLQDLFGVMGGEASGRVWRGFGTFFEHLVVFPFDFFSVLLPWSLVFVLAARWTRNKDPVYRSALLVFLATLVIYWILPTGKNRYLMPAIPFLAIAGSCVVRTDLVPPPRFQTVIWLLLATAFAGWGAFFLFKGHLVPIPALAAGAALSVVFSRKTWPVVRFAATFALAFLIFYIHGIYFYRSTTKDDYEGAAQRMAAAMDQDLPVLVDTTKRPVAFGFRLERALGRPLYSARHFTFDHYYLVTRPSKESPLHTWTVTLVENPRN